MDGSRSEGRRFLRDDVYFEPLYSGWYAPGYFSRPQWVLAMSPRTIDEELAALLSEVQERV